MKYIIEIRKVSAAYGKEEILHDVSLNIAAGEFVVMIGPSGCGKTTLLKMINGLVQPESGTISLDGEELDSCDLIQLRRHIGYAVQGAKLFGHMTVEDNICYVPQIAGVLKKQDKESLAEEMLTLVQLPIELKSRFPTQLSGGQQQRVGIARALANRPRILLMDEPFGAVDEITRRRLQSELLDLQRKTNITVVFITHDIGEAIRLGSRIIVMKEGRIVQEGTGKELMHNPEDAFVRELFGYYNNDKIL